MQVLGDWHYDLCPDFRYDYKQEVGALALHYVQWRRRIMHRLKDHQPRAPRCPPSPPACSPIPIMSIPSVRYIPCGDLVWQACDLVSNHPSCEIPGNFLQALRSFLRAFVLCQLGKMKGQTCSLLANTPTGGSLVAGRLPR